MSDAEHTYKFNVTMTCGGCSGAVDRVLKKLDGKLIPSPGCACIQLRSTIYCESYADKFPALLLYRRQELRSVPRHPVSHSYRRAGPELRTGPQDYLQDGQESQLGRGRRRVAQHRSPGRGLGGLRGRGAARRTGVICRIAHGIWSIAVEIPDLWPMGERGRDFTRPIIWRAWACLGGARSLGFRRIEAFDHHFSSVPTGFHYRKCDGELHSVKDVHC